MKTLHDRLVAMGACAEAVHLGSFRNEIEAAQNYDMAARNMGYIESSLNFPQMRSTND